jgi:hypothetical protein
VVLGPSAGNSGPQTEQAGNRQGHHTQYIVAHAAVVFRRNRDGNEVNDRRLAARQKLLQQTKGRPKAVCNGQINSARVNSQARARAAQQKKIGK